MGIEIALTTNGEEQILAALDGLDERTEKLAPAFHEIAFQIYAEEWMIFENEGGYRGRPEWPDLDESYAAQKTAIRSRSSEEALQFADDKIMQLTGALKASLTNSSARGAVLEISEEGMALGTDLKVHGKRSWNLAFIHAKPERKGTPTRETLSVVDQQVQEWADILTKHFKGELV